jgi:hypothetical protein
MASIRNEHRMAKSLKQKNQPQLITFVVSNAVALGAIALGLPNFVDLLQQLSKGDWRVIGKLVAVPAFLTLVTGIIGWAMPRTAKEFLVFWRTRNCLPSSRAFTVIGLRDPRIDMQRLVSSYGPIPEKPDQQTALWYRIYRGHKDDASVEDAHGAYLKFREMATLSIALIALSGCLAAYFGIGRRQLFLGALLLIIEYLIVMSAARNAATRLVSNVLAIESAATSNISQ